MRPAILDLLLPPACAACGRFGSVICAECQRSFSRPDPGDFVEADAGVVLGTALTLGLGAFVFTGPMRRALGRLKYAGAARAAGPLAVAAAPALGRLVAVVGPGAVLVPAPLHATRQRQRGYNQAALLAIELARLTGLPVADVLERHAATERMHHLDRAARLRNLRGAIRLRAGARCPPTPIVVDDILTTSATLEACASVLREGGAESVCGFAIAREV
jgi:ComF family protein